MFRLIRVLLLPVAVFFVIGGLALGEWGKISELKQASETFRKNSRIRIFKNAGEREFRGRPVPTYEYQIDGETREFPTHSEIDLPPDGRVRMGLDPFPQPERNPFSISADPQRELVVPINGPDSVETIYKGMCGHEIREDVMKASLVSVAAVIAGVAGFFLQRTLFRDVRRAMRPR